MTPLIHFTGTRVSFTTCSECASALAQRHLPHRVRKKSGDYQPGADAIQVMTMKVSKGLEFPVVTLVGVGHMPAAGEDETEAARVFYVAASNSTCSTITGLRARVDDVGLVAFSR